MASNIETTTEEDEIDSLRALLIHRWIHHNEPHEKVAEKAGLAPVTVRKFIRWQTKKPQTETLRRLGLYVGLRLTWVEIGAPRQPSEPRLSKKILDEVVKHRAQYKDD